MTRKSNRRPTDERLQRPGINARLPWIAAVAAILLVPIVMSLHGQDPFRLPKDLLFLALAITIAAASASLWLVEWAPSGAVRSVTVLAAACVLWTALASLFSSNYALSNRSILWVAAVAVFAFAVDFGGRKRGILAIAWPLLPAAVNAAIFLLQRFHIWNPMTFPADVPEHMRYTGLLGNPDDVGSLLVAPTLVAVALALCDRRRRALWIPVGALLLFATATGRLTALLACGAGLLVMGFLRSWRVGTIAATLLLAAGIALVVIDPPMRERAATIASTLRSGDYSSATNGRVTPFLTALIMTRSHPVFGVGPGCFRWCYYEYKIAAERAHPSLARAWSADFNFAETHNDHLQTLAETGIPGYSLFVLALIVLAKSSRRKLSIDRNDETDRDVLVRTLALPLSVAISVLCLAHFPLHLAASTVLSVYIAVLCVAWGNSAEVKTSTVVNERLSGLAGSLGLPRFLSASAVLIVWLIAAFLTWHLVLEPWKSNVTEKAIEMRTTLIYEAVTDPIRASRNARENLAALEPCLKTAPYNVALYMLKAANERIIGRYDDAATSYREALQYDRRPELYYNLGLMELELNQRPAAITDLVTAVTFSRAYLRDLPLDVQNQINDVLRRQYPYLLGS